MGDYHFSFQVIATNYDGYMIMYSCDPDEGEKYQMDHPELELPTNGLIWGFTREPQIDEQKVKEMEMIINQ